MSLLRSHRLSSYLILHQRSALCVPIEFQQRRQLGLYRRYETFLETKYPKAYKVHRLIVDGCRSCGGDIKNYFLIRRALNNGTRSLSTLNNVELFSYIQCPPELLKLVLLLCILQIPGPGDLLILAALFFPRHVLTRHFWTEAQKQKFWQRYFKESHQPHIRKLTQITCPKYTKEVPLSANDLAKVKMPDLNDLDFKHLFELFRLHNISMLTGTNGLKKHATLLGQLDKLMVEDKEIIENLTDIQLKNHLYVRRLSFEGKSTDEMRQLLRDWTTNLKDLSNEPTIYLHAPALLDSKPTKSVESSKPEKSEKSEKSA